MNERRAYSRHGLNALDVADEVAGGGDEIAENVAN